MADRAQVTNYYDPSISGARPQGEIEQGRLLIDSAKEVGVQFFVWRLVELAISCALQSDSLAVRSRTRPNCRMGSILASIISIVGRTVIYLYLHANVPFPDKAEVEEYLKQSGLPSATIQTGLLSCSGSLTFCSLPITTAIRLVL